MAGEDFWGNLLGLGIILMLVLVVYLKWTKKTIGDLVREIKEVNSDGET